VEDDRVGLAWHNRFGKVRLGSRGKPMLEVAAVQTAIDMIDPVIVVFWVIGGLLAYRVWYLGALPWVIINIISRLVHPYLWKTGGDAIAMMFFSAIWTAIVVALTAGVVNSIRQRRSGKRG
jgi:hypothetical protein